MHVLCILQVGLLEMKSLALRSNKVFLHSEYFLRETEIADLNLSLSLSMPTHWSDVEG